MFYLIGCSCGGLFKVRDTRTVGLSVVFRLRCDCCGESVKRSKPLDGDAKRIPDEILVSSKQHSTTE